MTVTYSLQVSKARLCGFAKLLFRWRGSIYRLLYREMMLYAGLYYFVAFLYRIALNDGQKRVFEKMAIYCRSLTDLVPITFVMGFYVAIVVARWWQQYEAIPWPDRTCLNISAYVHGTDERGRLIRRTLARYLNLMAALTMRSVSTLIYKRFPTMDHLLEAGICTVDERIAIEETLSPHGNWWIPAAWFSQLVMMARKEGRIHDDMHLKSIMDEMCTFRGGCGTMWNYDWISVPLVYTQVVTIAVYSFFTACLFGRQYLYEVPDHAPQDVYDMDYYIPVLTAFQFFFYVGWLKVAEELICPYGEDDDDFELNWIVDRNLQVSYMIVDGMHRKYPKLSRDIHWNDLVAELPYTAAAADHRTQPFMGSTFNMNLEHEKMDWVSPMAEFDPMIVEMKQKLDHIDDDRHMHDDDDGEETSVNGDIEARHPNQVSKSRRHSSNRSRAQSIISRAHYSPSRLRRRLHGLIVGNSRQSLNRGVSQFGSKESLQSGRPSHIIATPRRDSESRGESHLHTANGSLVSVPPPVPPVINDISNSRHKGSMSLANYRARRIPAYLHSDSTASSCWADPGDGDMDGVNFDSILSVLAAHGNHDDQLPYEKQLPTQMNSTSGAQSHVMSPSNAQSPSISEKRPEFGNLDPQTDHSTGTQLTPLPQLKSDLPIGTMVANQPNLSLPINATSPPIVASSASTPVAASNLVTVTEPPMQSTDRSPIERMERELSTVKEEDSESIVTTTTNGSSSCSNLVLGIKQHGHLPTVPENDQDDSSSVASRQMSEEKQRSSSLTVPLLDMQPLIEHINNNNGLECDDTTQLIQSDSNNALN